MATVNQIGSHFLYQPVSHEEFKDTGNCEFTKFILSNTVSCWLRIVAYAMAIGFVDLVRRLGDVCFSHIYSYI